MQIARYLKARHVRLELVNGHVNESQPPDEATETELEIWWRKERERLKSGVIQELAELFNTDGQIRNMSKFLKDFTDRERKASTALGRGVAVPHVRSMQTRKLALIFARSVDGVWFDAPDEEPVHFFFGVIAPSHEDPTVYMQFYQWFARSFRNHEWLPEALMTAPNEDEIVKILVEIQD